jgi:phosphoadenosine phosphosulfate reductase
MIASHQVSLEEKRFDEIAIQRLRDHEPPEGYWLAFSGGKDSVVIYDLAERAGVKFDAHFNRTTVDPPDVLSFIREQYPVVVWEKPKRSMFELIRYKQALPTRIERFCCNNLKEIGGNGRTIITGIRWEESTARRSRLMYEESYKRKNTWFLHPIIDWTTLDVWDYIRERRLPYCSLYNEGYNRIGCILCPFLSIKAKERDIEKYPRFYQAYLRQIQWLIDHGKKWSMGNTAEEVMHWWIYGKHRPPRTRRTR